jgi:hypothetical protein
METPRSNRFEPSRGVWVLIAAVVLINVWYDYYHPLGIIFDVIIAVIFLTAYLKKGA